MFFTWKKPAHALREEGGVLCTLLLFQGIIMQLFALWELRWMQILQFRNGFHHTGRCWINLSQALLFFQQISTPHSLSCASLFSFQDSNSQIFPGFLCCHIFITLPCSELAYTSLQLLQTLGRVNPPHFYRVQFRFYLYQNNWLSSGEGG